MTMMMAKMDAGLAPAVGDADESAQAVIGSDERSSAMMIQPQPTP